MNFYIENTSGGIGTDNWNASWSSDNTSVASAGSGGVFNRLAYGTFNAIAMDYVIDPNADCGDLSGSPCPVIQASAFSSGTVTDFGGLLQYSGLFDSWTDYGDGTVDLNPNNSFGALIDLYQYGSQCGCLSVPDLSDDPALQNAIVQPPANSPQFDFIRRSLEGSVIRAVAWFLNAKVAYRSPTGSFPGYDPNNPQGGGWQPNPAQPGDFIRNKGNGGYQTLHPNLDQQNNPHGPHWDFTDVGSQGNVLSSGRIYDDPNGMMGIYVPNQ